jgi:hypothetical protein
LKQSPIEKHLVKKPLFVSGYLSRLTSFVKVD